MKINKKCLLIALFIVFAHFLFVIESYADKIKNFTKITKFGDIGQELFDEQTLILLDVDYTILKPKGYYGSAAYFRDMVEKEIEAKNCTVVEAKMGIFDRYVDSQHNLDSQLVDDQIHNFIEDARSRGSLMLAFTARFPSSAQVTSNQLLNHNISFHLPDLYFIQFYRNQILPDKVFCSKDINRQICEDGTEKRYNHSLSLFYDGVLFGNALNTKGLIFKDFYPVLTEYYNRKSGKAIKRVIFVDDRVNNLESLEKASKELGLEFHGYLMEVDLSDQHYLRDKYI